MRGRRSPGIAGAKSLTGDIATDSIVTILKDHTWDAVVDWIAFQENDVERDYRFSRLR